MRVRAVLTAVGIASIALIAIVLFGDSGGYRVTARFQNASQLVPGNPVLSGGVTIGSVRDIDLTDDGRADVSLTIEDDSAPLPRGTRVTVRQFSLSGIANRFVEVTLPGGLKRGDIPDGGRIGVDETRSHVDIDQVANAFDPATRKGLQRVVQEGARSVSGRGKELGRGLHYLNPAMATTSALIAELTRDRPLLEGVLTDSSRLMTALSGRREELAALVGGLRDTFRALRNQKSSLAESIGRLPPFLRRSNTTFVNLRAALDDVDPLVTAAKPVARRLRPVLSETRALVAASRPTMRDLSLALVRRGRDNDLTDYARTFPPLADIATVSRARSVSPGGRRVGVGEVPGAFSQAASGLRAASPVIALGRPHTMDLIGWLDDYSTTGGYFDALGGIARARISFAESSEGGPPKQGQFKRCPGGADVPLRDGSNVLSAAEQRELGCDESHRAVR
jgi:phospholipid/cholesterol/gamma-HCH transport system substrate-binding protein